MSSQGQSRDAKQPMPATGGALGAGGSRQHRGKVAAKGAARPTHARGLDVKRRNLAPQVARQDAQLNGAAPLVGILRSARHAGLIIQSVLADAFQKMGLSRLSTALDATGSRKGTLIQRQYSAGSLPSTASFHSNGSASTASAMTCLQQPGATACEHRAASKASMTRAVPSVLWLLHSLCPNQRAAWRLASGTTQPGSPPEPRRQLAAALRHVSHRVEEAGIVAVNYAAHHGSAVSQGHGCGGALLRAAGSAGRRGMRPHRRLGRWRRCWRRCWRWCCCGRYVRHRLAQRQRYCPRQLLILAQPCQVCAAGCCLRMPIAGRRRSH